ncbi:hypothetical protein OPV22_019888 [Ensete ventricosum]|uniref:Uncharacterized protein n=1 Tax=Ensete ventricosum TaxID=4639 RepID=A0AAV8PBL2_ENSVE|nr:hypothetical protein OPV22_019888 [Ensete ventricosum]
MVSFDRLGIIVRSQLHFNGLTLLLCVLSKPPPPSLVLHRPRLRAPTTTAFTTASPKGPPKRGIAGARDY